MTVADLLLLKPGDHFHRLDIPMIVTRIRIVPLAGDGGIDHSYLELIYEPSSYQDEGLVTPSALYSAPIRPNLELREFSRDSELPDGAKR